MRLRRWPALRRTQRISGRSASTCCRNTAGAVLGKMLVRALCAAIEARGKMPFYGASLSNLHSQNIALESGFYPHGSKFQAESRPI